MGIPCRMIQCRKRGEAFIFMEPLSRLFRIHTYLGGKKNNPKPSVTTSRQCFDSNLLNVIPALPVKHSQNIHAVSIMYVLSRCLHRTTMGNTPQGFITEHQNKLIHSLKLLLYFQTLRLVYKSAVRGVRSVKVNTIIIAVVHNIGQMENIRN